MKIQFPDKSYIELIKSNSPNKLLLTIAARGDKDTLIASTVELTTEQFNQLIKIDQ